MYIYLLFFFLSFLCIGISKKIEKNKKISLFFELLGIFLLSLLAAVRDISIGTDVALYVKPIFDLCVQYGNFDVASLIYGVESGYLLLNYVVSFFTNDFSTFLFIIQVIVLGFSYFGIKKLYPKNYAMIYILFILLYYNMSLNVVRQSIALALSLYSLYFLFNEKYKRFFFILILASFFHKSVFIVVIVYFVYLLLIKMKMNKYFLSIAILAFGFILFLFFPQIIKFMVSIHLISPNYLYYLTNYISSTLSFNVIEVLFDLFIIVIYILFAKVYYKNDKKSSLYFIMVVIDLAFMIICSKYASVYRMGLYFRVPAWIYFFSNLNYIFAKKKSSNFFANFLGILILLIYWFFVYVVGKSGGTVPFIFS